ncbi:MAG: hypothetical protein KAR37_14260 [Alphaproteobacteria bacterium]|nr:hypothetical protein [Alphaproteobacteria bacterium]
MNFKRIVTLAVAGALLAAQPAAAGEDATRFKEVETWEGSFFFEIATTSTLPGGMEVEIFEKVKGSVSVSRATIDPTGRQLDWEGTSRIDLSMTGRKQMNMGEMSGDIQGSGRDSGEGKASLSIDTVAGTYTLKLGKLKYKGEWSGTIQAGDQVTPYNETQRAKVRPQVKKRPLPASGLALKDSGTIQFDAGMGTITTKFRIALNTDDEQEEPKVVTNVPKCKCVYPARGKTEKETLIVQARVENGDGGKFVSFQVEPEGKKPEYRESLLDTEADLYLDFDQTTGPVTVTAVYE